MKWTHLCTAYRDEKKLLNDYALSAQAVKDQHIAFVKKCLEIFRQNIFLIEEDSSPYFDTGLIIKSPTMSHNFIESPTMSHNFSFISHLSKILFGSTIFKMMKMYRGHVDIAPSDGDVFEQRMTTTLMINGLDLSSMKSYQLGTPQSLPSIPIPLYEFNLTFGYNIKVRGKTKVQILVEVKFMSEAEKQRLRDWFSRMALYSRSVMLTSTQSGRSMPAFNNVVIVQHVTNISRSTHVIAIQSSLEEHTKPTIKASRFKGFLNNGRKLEEILKALDPEFTVKCENKRPE